MHHESLLIHTISNERGMRRSTGGPAAAFHHDDVNRDRLSVNPEHLFPGNRSFGDVQVYSLELADGCGRLGSDSSLRVFVRTLAGKPFDLTVANRDFGIFRLLDPVLVRSRTALQEMLLCN